MEKKQNFDEVIDLGAATVETLGSTEAGSELINPQARDVSGISDID